MRRADLRVAKVAADQRGIVRRTDAAKIGVTDRDVDRLLEVGLLVAVHPGVYRHAAVAFDETARLLSAVWAEA